jgi:hypothetical protein
MQKKGNATLFSRADFLYMIQLMSHDLGVHILEIFLDGWQVSVCTYTIHAHIHIKIYVGMHIFTYVRNLRRKVVTDILENKK